MQRDHAALSLTSSPMDSKMNYVKIQLIIAEIYISMFGANIKVALFTIPESDIQAGGESPPAFRYLFMGYTMKILKKEHVATEIFITTSYHKKIID